MLRTRAAVVAAAAALTVAGLAGCGDDSADDGAQEPVTETPAQESSSTSTTDSTPAEPVAAESDCLVGEWLLDTVDYEAQAFAFMSGLGIPVESLTIDGEQVVEFQDRGVMSVRTNLKVDAVVYGFPMSNVSQSSGNGEWSTGSGGLEVANWIWGVEPAATGPDEASLPLFDPTGGPSVAECGGDALRLQGPDAPLAGNFVRGRV